jgi:RNA polymerase-interacting CarD/CdnL/TRCF family regulator
MKKQENNQLTDLERTIMLAYSALLNDEVELAKQILAEQIEKTYGH